MNNLPCLPSQVEALECFSSSSSVVGSNLGNSTSNGHLEVLPALLQPSPSNHFNWLSADVALRLETYTKFDLAIHHFSRFIRQHPCWRNANSATTENSSYPNGSGIHEFGKLREQLLSTLFLDLSVTEQKFQLHDAPLLSRVSLFLVNNFPFLHQFPLQFI